MIGKTILNYEIKSLIGEGGMGNVYLAEHTQVKRRVAIKVLLPQFLKNEDIKTRFKNEASTLAHLQHPGIVALFDYLEDETGMYLIMEYVEGMELDQYIQTVTGPMPEQTALPIMTQILRAFSYAHAKGIVHRDIKPANILIAKDGTVKILDFGIARILGEGNSNLTKTGTQMGTVFYMSPEQVQGKKVDIRSDIYSLGVTFYQMLTGLNPYKGLTTEYEVYNKIVKEELPPASLIYPGVPQYLESIVKRSLEKEPAERFQTCDDFLNAIEEKRTELQKPKQSPSASVPPPNQGYANPTPPPVPSSSSGMALASIILSILCLGTSFVPPISFGSIVLGILSIIFAAVSLKRIKNNQMPASATGMGIAGLILGLIGTISAIVVSLLFLITVVLADKDGDGFIDSEDKCKDIAGTLNGCPDEDEDGLVDGEDKCPEAYGEFSNGCPDSDNDGINDYDDKCPKDYFIENFGCPYDNKDGDSLPDKEDDCDDEIGPIDNKGCPLGSVVFYINSSPYAEDGYTVELLDRFDRTRKIGSIRTSVDYIPNCGDYDCATFDELKYGEYNYSVSDYNEHVISSGYVTIVSNECVPHLIEIMYEGPNEAAEEVSDF